MDKDLSQLNNLPVTVAGGGIAGLAAASAFAQRGAQVTLYERAAEITEVGAGLQISPNGVAVLDALGLARQARGTGQQIQAIELLDGASGRVVARLDVTRQARPYLAFHRADLIALLESTARHAGVKVALGRALTEPADAGLTVAADGLHSAFRARLNGGGDPFFTGQVAWRALVAGDGNPDPVARVLMGPGRHLVTYPLRGGRLINIVAVEERGAWTAEGWNHLGDPGDMRAAFAGFHRSARALLERVEKVHLWGLFRHRVAERWHDGRALALAGDAAHPTLPFLAQGANMALEDAWVLADCLARDGTAGLAHYEALRKPRVTRAIETANANARNYHMRAGPTRFAAHAGLAALSRIAPAALTARFDWLYGHDVTRTTTS